MPRGERGRLKQALLKVGWPADDQAGYVDGAAHPITLLAGQGFDLRPYQQEAVDAFLAAGSGVIVLPCGAGKTIVGIAAMARPRLTLVLTTSIAAVRQWRAEILDAPPRRGRGGRVHAATEGDRPGHAGDVPDRHHPPGSRYPHFELLRQRTGA